ncbi:hypothetical protein AWV79_15890 [Cupriavidus sp. UYMMa02A]|nr:hypothetical protein AWV79_15890 [Cupriavidus sp. UYMMa02A]
MGARYRIDKWRLNGLYASVRNTFTSATVHAAELGAVRCYWPWVLGFSVENNTQHRAIIDAIRRGPLKPPPRCASISWACRTPIRPVILDLAFIIE